MGRLLPGTRNAPNSSLPVTLSCRCISFVQSSLSLPLLAIYFRAVSCSLIRRLPLPWYHSPLTAEAGARRAPHSAGSSPSLLSPSPSLCDLKGEPYLSLPTSSFSHSPLFRSAAVKKSGLRAAGVLLSSRVTCASLLSSHHLPARRCSPLFLSALLFLPPPSSPALTFLLPISFHPPPATPSSLSPSSDSAGRHHN